MYEQLVRMKYFPYIIKTIVGNGEKSRLKANVLAVEASFAAARCHKSCSQSLQRCYNVGRCGTPAEEMQFAACHLPL